MSRSYELRQRLFIGDLLDAAGELQKITLTLEEKVWEDGATECLNEDLTLNDRYVTYNDLARRFGKTKIEAFMEEATENAR